MQIHLEPGDACAREKSSREPLETSFPHSTHSLPRFDEPIPLICITFDQSRPVIIRGRGIPRPLRPLWKKKVICPLGTLDFKVEFFNGTFVPRAGRRAARTFYLRTPFYLTMHQTCWFLPGETSSTDVGRSALAVFPALPRDVWGTRRRTEGEARLPQGCEKFSIRILYIEIPTRSPNFKLKPGSPSLPFQSR